MKAWQPWNWVKKENIEKDVAKAQYEVDRWIQVREMLKSNGWHFIGEDLKRELARADSLLGVTKDNLDDKSGYCRGLKYILARIQEYERVAKSAEETLMLANKQQE